MNFALTLALCTLLRADAPVPVLRPSALTGTRITMVVGSDRALVRESCTIALPAGRSELRFQWTDADIDASSVALFAPPDVTVGGGRQLSGEGKTFIWPVEVKEAGERAFVATYSLGGLRWSPAYYLTFDAGARTATLVGKLHLTNDSRLPIRRARVELCVTAAGAVDQPGAAAQSKSPGALAALEGCTLEPGWQRRVTFLTRPGLPARLAYRVDYDGQKNEVRRILYLDLRDLGLPGALPKGHLEVYEATGGARRFVTGTDLNHVTDKETEIALGPEGGVVFERKTLSSRKTDVEFDRIGRVSGFDTTEEICDLFRNHLPVAAHMEVLEKIPGKWDLKSKVAPTKTEANQVTWEFDLAAGARSELTFSLTRHTGTRAK